MDFYIVFRTGLNHHDTDQPYDKAQVFSDFNIGIVR